jgi:hypothetical protein
MHTATRFGLSAEPIARLAIMWIMTSEEFMTVPYYNPCTDQRPAAAPKQTVCRAE